MKGMKIGMSHNWNYKVHNYKSTKKKNKEYFTEVQSKSRNTKAPYGTGLKTGSKLVWGLEGKFYTTRSNGKWKTTYLMNKRQIKVKPKGKKWF